MPDFLYRRDGALWTPTEWAGSPWSKTSQHGGPVNALFMYAAEEAAAECELCPARLTVDLFKPVPTETLSLTWRFLRRGRRLAVVEATLARPGAGDAFAGARAVLLAQSPGRESYWVEPEEALPDPAQLESGSLVSPALRTALPPGFHLTLDLRRGEAACGPVVWLHTPLALTEDRPLTPLERLAATADMTFGVCTRTPPRGAVDRGGPMRAMLINTDTTLHVERPPEGEWLAFTGDFLSDREGIGVAEVTIHDVRGRVGRSVQTLVANSL